MKGLLQQGWWKELNHGRREGYWDDWLFLKINQSLNPLFIRLRFFQITQWLAPYLYDMTAEGPSVHKAGILLVLEVRDPLTGHAPTPGTLCTRIRISPDWVSMLSHLCSRHPCHQDRSPGTLSQHSYNPQPVCRHLLWTGGCGSHRGLGRRGWLEREEKNYCLC